MSATTRQDFVLLLLRRDDGRFLLQHRDDDAPTYGGYWGFFGGCIEEGETPEDALRREAFEELHYAPRSSVPVLVRDYRDEARGTHGTRFYFCDPFSETTKLEQHEGQGMGWFFAAETGTLKMRPDNRFVLQKLEELLRR